MTSVASTIKRIVRSAAYVSHFSSWVAQKRPWKRIIMYHAIRPEDATNFEAQLKYLENRFSIVPLGIILQRMSDPAAVFSREIALTFDDGLRNHFSVAYPVLKRLNLPATFFVSPGLLGSGQWLWNHEARSRLRTLLPGRQTELFRELGAPGSKTEDLIEWMKTLVLATRAKVEDLIRAATPDFTPSLKDHENFDIMSWEELASLEQDLITVGSHTTNHPLLTSLDDQGILSEVCGSRVELEKRLNRSVEYFCYPNGVFDDRALLCVREHYRAAVTTQPGAVVVGSDPHMLPRIPNAEDLSLLAWRMHRPGA